MKPGVDPAEIYPALARKPDAAEAAAFEAEVEEGYRLLAVLREEVASLRTEMKRRRDLEAKYSLRQPRVPAGNPRGGGDVIRVCIASGISSWKDGMGIKN